MVSIHIEGSSCANLRNARTTSDIEQVNCSRCILSMNKSILKEYIKESSKYEHSNYVGVELDRAIPKWAVMGFQSYTTPAKAIDHAFKLSTPELMFERREFSQIVTLRELNPHIQPDTYFEVLRAFKTCMQFVIDQLNAHTDLDISIAFYNESIQVENPRTKSRVGEVHALRITSDLGYVPQFVLSIIVGKIANIRLQRPDLSLFRLMEQIFSNQSNTSQKAYRTMIKALLNGTLYEIEDYSLLFPQICGLHHEIVDSAVSTPDWLSINRTYKSELRIVEEGL